LVTWQHGSDEWESPQTLFAFLDQFFRFDCDVCATPQTAKCRKFWTKDDDGLKQAWEPNKVYWMNGPYSQAGRWARKQGCSTLNT
jgi:site-specific DNA-methyltransferase (adenine-specific)